jgi:hypothetical protein
MNGPIVLTFLQLKDKMFISLVLIILTPFSCTTLCIDVSGFSIKNDGCPEVDFYLEWIEDSRQNVYNDDLLVVVFTPFIWPIISFCWNDEWGDAGLCLYIKGVP